VSGPVRARRRVVRSLPSYLGQARLLRRAHRRLRPAEGDQALQQAAASGGC
jgi:hypothetical protein